MDKITFTTKIDFFKVCDICHSPSMNLVDAKKYVSRSVTVMVKICQICRLSPILPFLGYSLLKENEKW